MSIVDWLFPKLCVSCGREGEYICSECRGKLKPPAQVCPMCSSPSIDGWTHPRCRKRDGVERLIVGLSYPGIVQNCLKKVKYQSAWDIVSFLWELWGERVSFEQLRLSSDFVVTAVPMWEVKQRERGFNQAEIVAKMMAQKYSLPFLPLLKRVRATRPMYGLDRKKRKENIKDAFMINPKSKILKFSNIKKVLLIDDVWTTGATMRECAKVLKKCGAVEVWGVTLAR